MIPFLEMVVSEMIFAVVLSQFAQAGGKRVGLLPVLHSLVSPEQALGYRLPK